MASKKSAREIKDEARRLTKQIEKQKEQAEKLGHKVIALNEDDIIRKIRGETSNSPFFTIHQWDGHVTAGTRTYYIANYYNPDPQLRLCFASMFVGLSGFDPDINTAIAARDTRWPYVSTELAFVQEGEVGVAYFEFPVPYVTRGTYFMNILLWEWALVSDGVSKIFDFSLQHTINVQ